MEGNLREQFSSAVKTDLQAEKLRELDLNLSRIEGGAENAGRMATGQDRGHGKSQSALVKEKKRFDELLRQLIEHKRWLMQEMTALHERIDKLTERIEEHGRNIAAINDSLEFYRENGAWQLDEDGYPANARVRTLIEEWEERTGQIWDASDENSADILRAIIEEQKLEQQTSIIEREAAQNEWYELNSAYHDMDGNIAKVENGKYINEVDVEIFEHLRAEYETVSDENSAELERNISFENLPAMSF